MRGGAGEYGWFTVGTGEISIDVCTGKRRNTNEEDRTSMAGDDDIWMSSQAQVSSIRYNHAIKC